MALDWIKIKNEYINTRTSYRKLAEKYGTHKDSIAAHAKAENWKSERDIQTDKIQTRTRQKIVEKAAAQEADRIMTLLAISDKLAERLNLAADQLDQMVVRHKKKHRTIEYGDKDARGKPAKEVIDEEEIVDVVDAPIDRQGLQQLSVALKNIRDVALAGKTDADAGGVTIIDDL